MIAQSLLIQVRENTANVGVSIPCFPKGPISIAVYCNSLEGRLESGGFCEARGGGGRLRDAGRRLIEAGLNEAAVAGDYLTGSKPFTAKLNPAYAQYGDYDQLMRLEEWYGRK